MKPKIVIVLLTLMLVSAGFCRAEGRKPDATNYRLTWAPYGFLEEGFRNAPWVRDPFFPDMNAFRLSGVISNEMAYINGNWYRQGETIEGYAVRDIGAEGVTLARGGSVLILKMEK